jgi:pSer/pThr/pTyr-binding forkhead associated (FHA) protein
MSPGDVSAAAGQGGKGGLHALVLANLELLLCELLVGVSMACRQHAQITVDASGAACLMDLGSAHGTKVGDVWIKPHALRALVPGAVVRFGASTRAYKLLSVEKVAGPA